jgi:hypothetical protein
MLHATFRRTSFLLALALAVLNPPLHAAESGRILIVVSGAGLKHQAILTERLFTLPSDHFIEGSSRLVGMGSGQ